MTNSFRRRSASWRNRVLTLSAKGGHSAGRPVALLEADSQPLDGRPFCALLLLL